jgi:S-methylmethionine-dependent homocysteine/selenocysteine methylase/SAM-dependent methyltransferase
LKEARQNSVGAPAAGTAPAYERTAALIEEGRCVVLDGAVGTELPRVGTGRSPQESDERLWGTRALIDTPDLVLDVHRRYVATGADVISTNTWGLASALAAGGPRLWDETGAPVHWMDIARRGLRLATTAVAEADRANECAVAFSLNADVDSADGRETIRLLARLFADEPARPDVVLVETLSVLRPSLFETVEELLGIGVPVWLSFRRCRHGVCGVYGEHWGGPEGDEFGRAARRFEQMGVGALLVNCIPPDHVAGMVSYLRDFCDLPLGVYPNLGYYTDTGWRFDPGVGGEEYARMALEWREEGAQIVGGCCGTRPDHIVAARERLAGTKPGRRRRGGLDELGANGGAAPRPPAPEPWTDSRDRRLYPLPFPDLAVDPGVQPPDEASFMVWNHLFREGIGAHQRCLDIGCGTGILGVQLALNGASHVRAIDVDRRAVANTLTNAFRNGVDGRLTATEVDLFPWTPEERYEVVVSSVTQQPSDPAGAVSSHRAVDYWGRRLIDQLIAKLAEALAPEGVAYLMQLSILSQQRTAELLGAAGFRAEVVDWVMYGFGPEHAAAREHVARVEELSDAHHLRVGDRDVLVAYLLEVTAKASAVNGRAALPGVAPPRAR